MSKAKIPSPAPPDHLSEKSKSLWRSIVPRRAKSPERLELLCVGLEALDRLQQVRLAILDSGMTSVTKSTGAVHLNPLLKAEKDSRQQFMQVWSALGLQWTQAIDGGRYDLGDADE